MRDSISASRGNWNERRERVQFVRQVALDRTHVIASDGVDVGFVTLLPGPGRLYIQTLCVAPEHQGRGVGSTVVQRVVAEGLKSNRVVSLSVLKANPRAQALYERLGFVVVGESALHFHLRYRRTPARPEQGSRAAPAVKRLRSLASSLCDLAVSSRIEQEWSSLVALPDGRFEADLRTGRYRHSAAGAVALSMFDELKLWLELQLEAEGIEELDRARLVLKVRSDRIPVDRTRLMLLDLESSCQLETEGGVVEGKARNALWVQKRDV